MFAFVISYHRKNKLVNGRFSFTCLAIDWEHLLRNPFLFFFFHSQCQVTEGFELAAHKCS